MGTGYYRSFINALAACAGFVILAMCASIVYDVVLRTAGIQPPFWTGAASEYALLWIALLGSPWLTREKGHVYVQLLGLMLPERAKWWLDKSVYALSGIICLTLGIAALVAAIDAYHRGQMDVRAIMLPSWLLYLPMAVSFFLVAVELSRFLLGWADYYDQPVTSQESL